MGRFTANAVHRKCGPAAQVATVTAPGAAGMATALSSDPAVIVQHGTPGNLNLSKGQHVWDIRSSFPSPIPYLQQAQTPEQALCLCSLCLVAVNFWGKLQNF